MSSTVISLGRFGGRVWLGVPVRNVSSSPAKPHDHQIRPVIPLRETPAVKAGKHNPPSCEHGTWTFAGSDAKRGASKFATLPEIAQVDVRDHSKVTAGD